MKHLDTADTKSNVSPPLSMAILDHTHHPFRLLHLPEELKAKIYEKYFEGTRVVLSSYTTDPHKGFIFTRMPSLALELTCRSVKEGSQRARSTMIDRVLSCRYRWFIFDDDKMSFLSTSSKYVWLRNHVQILELVEIIVPSRDRIKPSYLDWQVLIDNCPLLNSITVTYETGRLKANFRKADVPNDEAFALVMMKEALNPQALTANVDRLNVKRLRLPHLVQAFRKEADRVQSLRGLY